MNLAPIVLFAYNRPEHTRLTLSALSDNYLANESELIVFCDGPKYGATDAELKQIEAVRSVVKEKKWCWKVQIFESKTNKGLAPSVIEGINSIVNQYGKIIVLEDDLITSPWFLTYMNEGLLLYCDHSNVYSINGYMFPIITNRTDSVLLPYTSTWGWGTWKNKWTAFTFNMDFKEEIKLNPYLKSRFNMADYDYSSMLNFGNNSWGIRWYYSVFIRNGLGLFPTKSLIQNIGFDGSGENCSSTQKSSVLFIDRIINNEIHKTIDMLFISKYLNYFQNEKSHLKKSNTFIKWLYK